MTTQCLIRLDSFRLDQDADAVGVHRGSPLVCPWKSGSCRSMARGSAKVPAVLWRVAGRPCFVTRT